MSIRNALVTVYFKKFIHIGKSECIKPLNK